MNLTKRSEKPIKKVFKKGKMFRCVNCQKMLAQSVDLVEGSLSLTCSRCKADMDIVKQKVE